MTSLGTQSLKVDLLPTAHSVNPKNRLLVVQYTGDFRETYYRLQNNGVETYYAQRYSIELMDNYKQWCEEVATLVFHTADYYDETLPNGVRAIGAGFPRNSNIDSKRLLEMVSEFRPTHLVIRTPHVPLIKWAIRNKVKTLLMLADSFQMNRPKRIIKHYLLGRLLNNRCVEWIGNHGINSSLSLRKIGVNPNKIVPWDWPAAVTPSAFEPKSQISDPTQINLFFAGVISEQKGIGDVLRAIPLLKQQGINVLLKIAGKGDIDALNAEVNRLGIEESVKLLGVVPNNQIVNLMHESDVVLIPSRHDYPEGLPMTVYEALCSRTPIVASDHPMFDGRLQNDISALIFPQCDSAAIARCIAQLFQEPEVYHRLSSASAEAWEKLQISAKWGDVVEHWLLDSSEDRNWLSEHCLSSPLYARQIR